MEDKINTITLELARINGELKEAKQEIISLKTKLSLSEAKNRALTEENQKLVNASIPKLRNFNNSSSPPSYSDVSSSDEEVKALIDNDRENDNSGNKERRLSLNFKCSSDSVPFNFWTGMRDTFSILTPKSILTKEKQENELRKLAYQGNTDKVSKILNRDQTLVNGRGMPDSICSRVNGFYDQTPLMIAAKRGNLSCVKELIKHDADPNLWDRDNLTALDYSERNGHIEVSDYLRSNKALNGFNVPELQEQMVEKFKLA